MPKFMCVKDANSSQLREIWKTTAILSTELLKNHTTENHRCLWDNPAQLSTYIMDPELIWALCGPTWLGHRGATASPPSWMGLFFFVKVIDVRKK